MAKLTEIIERTMVTISAMIEAVSATLISTLTMRSTDAEILSAISPAQAVGSVTPSKQPHQSCRCSLLKEAESAAHRKGQL